MQQNVCSYQQYRVQRGSAGIVFTLGPIFRFFAPQGQHVAPIKVKFGMEEWTIKPMYVLSVVVCVDRQRDQHHPQLFYQPAVYVGSFVLPTGAGHPTDTFANMCGWFKVKMSVDLSAVII